jgi:hypothetical protein
MYTKHWEGNGWSSWASLGGSFKSLPAAVSWGTGRIDIFGIGMDGALYYKGYSGKQWQANWDNLGGTFTSAPTVVSWGLEKLDVFALGTDNAVYHKSWDGAQWSGWNRLG